MLEDEIVVSRSGANFGQNTVVQSDSTQDLMAMSLSCSLLPDDNSLLKGQENFFKVNTNREGKSVPSIGDCLLFIRANDNKFWAFGFKKVELDQRTLQDLSVSCIGEDGEDREI